MLPLPGGQVQHQQAERRSLLHVGAGDVALREEEGMVGTRTREKNRCPCGRSLGIGRG